MSLQGTKHRQHRGIAYLQHDDGHTKINSNGRIMLDPTGFRRFNPDCHTPAVHTAYRSMINEKLSQNTDLVQNLSDGENPSSFSGRRDKTNSCGMGSTQCVAKKRSISLEHKRVSDACLVSLASLVVTEAELLIASPTMPGFSFTEKRWLQFSLSGIEEVEWSSDAFESLVVPDYTKQTLRDLIGSYLFEKARDKDAFHQMPGKGLNIALHGPPGVGKTLTCEVVAEELRRPLYVVSVGEISDNAEFVQHQLREVFEMADAWGAIVLLDDAEVFLQARQSGDLYRNSVVTVFLRCMETHRGVLFLTMNQVETVDEGVLHRLHTGFRYEPLSAMARMKIWQHHLREVERYAVDDAEHGKTSIPVTEMDINDLSRRDLNGRQVRLPTAVGAVSVHNDAPLAFRVRRANQLADQEYSRDLHLYCSFGTGRTEYKSHQAYANGCRSSAG
jgi:hypothetical protein